MSSVGLFYCLNALRKEPYVKGGEGLLLAVFIYVLWAAEYSFPYVEFMFRVNKKTMYDKWPYNTYDCLYVLLNVASWMSREI